MMKRLNKVKYILLISFLVNVLPIDVYANSNQTLGDLRKVYESLRAEKIANDNKTGI